MIDYDYLCRNDQQDCQDNDDIDIGNIGGRTTVICQNGKDNRNKQNSIPKQQDCLENDEEIDIASIGERNTVICQNPRPTNNPIGNANIGTPTPPPRQTTTTPPRRTTTPSTISQGKQLGSA